MAFSERRNPYFRHAEAGFWLALRGGRPVGRISAQQDRLAPRGADGAPAGHFGLLAAEDDPAIYAALLALLFLALSVLVIRQRLRSRTVIGLGEAEGLLRASRAQGNFAEYVPILLILLRVVQGIAVGGEWGGAVLIATEHASPRRRAVFGSFAQFGVPGSAGSERNRELR